GVLGVTAVGNRLERRLLADGPGGGAPPRGVGLRHLFLWPVLGPFGLTLALVPNRWGWDAAAVLAFGAALMAVQLVGGWIDVLKRLGVGRPAAPRPAALGGAAGERGGGCPRGGFRPRSPRPTPRAPPGPPPRAVPAP